MISQTQFNSVLFVEDDLGHAMLIKRALKGHVSEVHHCESVSEAREILKGGLLPELIITDLKLPDSSHVEHVAELQALTHGRPVLVLTSSTSLDDVIAAMKLGAKDFIVKNFDQDFSEILGMSLARLHSILVIENERIEFQRQIELLKVAVESSHDGFAIANAAGVIEYSNSAFRAFVRLCGGSSNVLFECFSEVVLRRNNLIEDLQRRLTELPAGAVWHTEIGFEKKRDDAFDLSLSVMEDAIGRKCVVWVRNIAEQKRRERFQREILSTTTHDLKGPLGSVLLSADLITELAPDNGRVSELALRISSSARNSINLIDEFLSARRIQEGTFILKPSKVPVMQLINEVVGDYQASAAAKRISLQVKAVDEGLYWLVDKVGFTRVVSNLLSNAIKFTAKQGSVTIEALVREGNLQMSVSDNGSGMEPAEVQSIFDRFSRLDRHNAISGSGIGLFVVKSIVTAHGGRIEVTSKIGFGTTFTIILPEKPPVNDRGELISLDFA